MYLPFPENWNIHIYRAYRDWLWPHPRLHSAYLTLRGYPIRLNEIDIFVEGFGRSGNTFVVNALKMLRPELNIYSHVHVPVSIGRAVSAGKPVCFLIREPEDAIASFVMYDNWSVQRHLDHYIRYHEMVAEHLDNMVLCRFEDFTKDFNILIDGLNAKFNLGLANVDHNNLSRETFDLIDHDQIKKTGRINEMTVHRPSDERKRRKMTVLANIRESHPTDLACAKALHEAFTKRLDAADIKPNAQAGSRAARNRSR